MDKGWSTEGLLECLKDSFTFWGIQKVNTTGVTKTESPTGDG